jgi:hypothetical protein
MVALGECGDGALFPVAGEAEVMLGLAPDVVVAQVLVKCLCVVKVLVALVPVADVLIREYE